MVGWWVAGLGILGLAVLGLTTWFLWLKIKKQKLEKEKKFIADLQNSNTTYELLSKFKLYARYYDAEKLAEIGPYIDKPSFVLLLVTNLDLVYQAERFKALLANLKKPVAIDELCCLALSNEKVLEICLEQNYAPSEPLKRAEFYLLTRQWKKYQKLDLNSTLLTAIFQQDDALTKRRILANIQRDGMTALLDKVAAFNLAAKAEETEIRPDRPDWSKINALRDSGQWAELWELAQKTSAFHARLILAMFGKAGQAITTPTEKPLFDRLLSLAQKCEAAPFASPLLNSEIIKRYRVYEAVNPVVAFTSSGNFFAVATGQGVQIWETAVGKQIGNFEIKSGIFTQAFVRFYKPKEYPDDDAAFWPSALAFSPDDKTLAAIYNSTWFEEYGYGVLLFDCASQIELTPLLAKSSQRFPNKVLFSRDNRDLLIFGNNWLEVAKLENRTVSQKLRFEAEVTQAEFSPDGELLAVGLRMGLIEFYAYPSLKRDTVLRSEQTGSIQKISFSPDGQLLACGQYLTVWNLENSEKVSGFNQYLPAVMALDFNPSGQVLAVATPDLLVRLWSVDGNLLQNLKSFDSVVQAIKYTADGQHLVTFSEDGEVRIWTSRLIYLYNLPLAQAKLADLKWLKEKVTDPAIAEPERAWLEYIAAHFELKWRYEIEVENAPARPADRFDIEVEE